MSLPYEISAIRYRPISFSDVVGQSAVVDGLNKSISNNEIARSYLFCGPRGVGKTTCARIFSKRINGVTATDDKDSDFNIFELDAASNNSVNHIRQLIEQTKIPPQKGRYKVYIIDEVHMLSQTAFNAFLKTLEEPPSYVVFILATTEKHKIIPTILSRCQIYDFKRISDNDVINYLQNIADDKSIKVDKESLRMIAQKCEGAMRDALSLFDKLSSTLDKVLTYSTVAKELNILDVSYYFKILYAIIEQDLKTVLIMLDDILAQGYVEDVILEGMLRHIRELLVFKVGAIDITSCSEGIKQQYEQQVERIQKEHIIDMIDILDNSIAESRFNKNKRLSLDLVFIRLCSIQNIEKKKEHLIDSSSIPNSVEPKIKVETNVNSKDTTKDNIESSKSTDKSIDDIPYNTAQKTDTQKHENISKASILDFNIHTHHSVDAISDMLEDNKKKNQILEQKRKEQKSKKEMYHSLYNACMETMGLEKHDCVLQNDDILSLYPKSTSEYDKLIQKKQDIQQYISQKLGYTVSVSIDRSKIKGDKISLSSQDRLEQLTKANSNVGELVKCLGLKVW